MSAFGGRRAPNVSQYVANLNTIPSAHDVASQQQDGFNLEDDLAIFTNTEFFDFDMGENTVGPSLEFDPLQDGQTKGEDAAVQAKNDKGLDFLEGDYQFQDFSGFEPGNALVSAPVLSQTSSFPPQNMAIPQVVSPTSSLGDPHTGDKRRFEAVLDSSSANSLEDASRMVAEEDKRRRNTAASARFRVKKKQREQNLERTAKAMTDKASALEARIGQLEMENKWLKSLITEKNENKDDIAELWQKFTKEGADGRSTSERKDGVGTLAKAQRK